MASFKSLLADMVRKAREDNTVPPELFVDDHLDDAESRHQVPSKEQLKFGPTEAASGEGVVRMIGDYSNPAPQQAITEEYIEFNRAFDKRLKKIEKAVSDMAKGHNQMASLVGGIVAAVEKAEAQDDEDKEMREMTEKAVRKAKVALFKAEMDEDDDDNEEVEESVISAEKAVNAAIKALVKAAEEDEDDEEKMEKARKIAKALRERLKAIKAKRDDKGNQDDGEDPKSGNQEDAAAKSMEAAVMAALTKLGITKAEGEPKDKGAEEVQKSIDALSNKVSTVSDLLNSLMGKSVGTAPTFQKAEAKEMLKSRIDALSKAINEECLSDSDTAVAQRILSRIIQVQDGAIDASKLDEELRRAPESVLRLVG
ncbi:MAG: hypothetical protein M0Z68_06215 [Gammaproteobacteria bacterium]|nr:hypothetical protein [Gammaproteobacteria bacterium]